MHIDHADNDQIRDRLLEVFELIRESPGCEYEPENFIHYLIANPGGRLNIHNSFKGKRFFVRFIERVQTVFAVCFSNNDLETLKSLTKMTTRVAYLQATPKSSLTVISNRLKTPFNFNIVLLIAFISFPLIAILLKLFSLIGLAGLVVPLLLIFLIIRMHRRDRAYHEQLRELITTGQAHHRVAGETAGND